jgi:Tol biopolymer transport system component
LKKLQQTRSIRGVLAPSSPYPFKQSDDLNAISVGIDAPPQFSFWKSYDVGLLLVGRVSVAAGGRPEAGFRLWDTVAQRQIAGRQYFAPAELKDRLALVLAADVFEELDSSHESAPSRIRER